MGVSGASGVTEQVAEILDKYPGGIRLVDSIEFLVAWARANSLWPLIYGTACCCHGDDVGGLLQARLGPLWC